MFILQIVLFSVLEVTLVESRVNPTGAVFKLSLESVCSSGTRLLKQRNAVGFMLSLVRLTEGD